MNKSDISVCIIARNEEENLGACLESLKNIAYEIILGDTGSSDGTKEIAARAGCTIIDIEWEHDFSKARNITIEKASKEFILIIDADERLQNPDKLLHTVRNASSKTGAWLVKVISHNTGATGGTDIYAADLLRIFRNRKEFRFKGIIHEQILEPILSAGYGVEYSDIEFDHVGYSYDADTMRIKQLRNLELLDEAVKQNPADGHALYQRAKTNLALGEFEAAESDTVAAIKSIPPASALKPQALNFGAVVALKLNEPLTAVWRSTESLKLVPNQAFANYLLGESYTELGRFDEALEAYLRSESARSMNDPKARIIGDYFAPAEQLNFRIGRSLAALNRLIEAESRFSIGLAQNDRDAACLVGLANIDYRLGRYNSALDRLNKAVKIDPSGSDIDKFITAVKKKIGESPDSTIENTELSLGKVMTSTPLITLSMIVKNEEKYLPGCLESVRGVVDEIVIVDTGSSDSTKEIAAEYGAKVIDFEWIGDFSAARNCSLLNSSGKWILYLDADERLTMGANAEKFRRMLSELEDEIGAMICTIESDHLQLDGSTEHHRGGYPRIFRNYGDKALFRGRVHEQITPSIIELGKSIILSDIVIEHLGYNVSREVMEQKIKRNYGMLIKHVQEEPLNAYAWYQLGQTLAQMSLFEEAERAIRFAIDLGKLSDSIYASAAATLSQLVGNGRDFVQSLHWAEESLKKAPMQVYAMNLKAYSLLYSGRFAEAEEAFYEVLRRLKAKRGVPQTGFDIDVPEAVILDGLRKAKERNSNL